MRIAICEFGNETNGFRKGISTFQTLSSAGWMEAETLLDRFRNSNSFIGGAIKAAEEAGDVVLVPISSLRTSPGPIIADEAADYIHRHIAEELAAVKDCIDGIYFVLHGGGYTESHDSLEIETVKTLRSVVGDKMPIVASLDLHGNIQQRLLDMTQGLFGIKENPHTDLSVTGYRAMQCLIRILKGESHPQMALVRLPMLLSAAACNTYNEPMKSVKEYFADYCEKHELLDTTLLHGFSGGDHPYSGASVLVVAEDYDPIDHAKTLAKYFWDRREEFVPVSLTPDQAIDLALSKVKDGYVIINEASDNPGSGCPGDGTHTLRALLERNLPNTIFMYIRDAEVVQQAHDAGAGAIIDILLGGKTDDMHGDPIHLENVEVIAISDGVFDYRTPIHKGLVCELGPCARLRHKNVEFVVICTRHQTLDDGVIYATGGDPENYKIIALKSVNHFRGYFEPRADAIVTSDPPGAACANLLIRPYKRVRRPIYPLDPDTKFDI